MPLTKKQLEYQREYRKRTGYAAAKKYQNSEKGIVTRKKAHEVYKHKINNNFDAFVSYLRRSLKSGAKSRDLAFNLNTKQLKEFLLDNPTCAETGRQVTYKQGCPNKASIDGINNRYGYSLKNIRVVIQNVNYARNDMTIKDFREMCIDIAKMHQKSPVFAL